jgi:hypothetical protein
LIFFPENIASISLAQIGHGAQRLQEPHRLGRGEILGIVQVPAADLEAERLRAGGIRGKQVAHRGALQLRGMRLQGLPFRSRVESFAAGHGGSPFGNGMTECWMLEAAGKISFQRRRYSMIPLFQITLFHDSIIPHLGCFLYFLTLIRLNRPISGSLPTMGAA